MAIDDGEVTIDPLPEPPVDASLGPEPDPVAAAAEDAGTEHPPGGSAEEQSRRSAQAAAIVFGAYLVVAFFLILFKYGSGYWFGGDEWGFLIDRQLSDPAGLIRPQHSHWSTIPIVVYQGLFKIFGLSSYLPFQVAVAVLHLTLATLVRVVMRRAGVGPWVATVVAGTFVLFGAGYENILLGVQISMVGSMVLGFTHLILADHDGPFDRRDAFGLTAGAIGLMCSGIAPPLVIVVGLATFVRRGWRMAVAHTAPLAALYGVWWLAQRSELDSQSAAKVSLDILLSWASTGETGVLLAIGNYRPVAIALFILLVGGLALAWIPLDLAEMRRRAAAPSALLVGALVLFALVGTQRWTIGVDFARSSRYVSMGTALTLPALAVAVDAVIRRWRVAAPVLLALLLVGVPANLAAFDDGAFTPAFYDGQRDFVLAVANSPLADEVSPDVQPDPNHFATDEVTVGFLRQASESGRAPEPRSVAPYVRAGVNTRLTMAQSRKPLPDGLVCRILEQPIELRPAKGEVFGIGAGKDVMITLVPEDETLPVGVPYQDESGSRLDVQLSGTEMRVGPAPPATSFNWCS